MKRWSDYTQKEEKAVQLIFLVRAIKWRKAISREFKRNLLASKWLKLMKRTRWEVSWFFDGTLVTWIEKQMLEDDCDLERRVWRLIIMNRLANGKIGKLPCCWWQFDINSVTLDIKCVDSFWKTSIFYLKPHISSSRQTVVFLECEKSHCGIHETWIKANTFFNPFTRKLLKWVKAA